MRNWERCTTNPRKEPVSLVFEMLLARVHQILKKNVSGSDNSDGTNSKKEEEQNTEESEDGEDDEDMAEGNEDINKEKVHPEKFN